MKNLPKEIGDIKVYNCYLTVGDLKRFLNNHTEIPDNAHILVERVEDEYYESFNWEVVYKEGESYQHAKKFQAEFDVSEQELKESLTQYHPAFCCLKYEDDENLYINLHY